LSLQEWDAFRKIETEALLSSFKSQSVYMG
jgi:hypothetical protein